MSNTKKQGVVADVMDNTATVKEIVDELLIKNDQAFTFYHQIVRQRRNLRRVLSLHCVVPGHPLNAFAEDWDGKVDTDYFELFPYKSLPPKMIMPIRNIGKVDPVSGYIKTKMEWQSFLKKSMRAAGFWKTKYENLNEDVIRCPKLFVDLAAHLDGDPDPYFDCAYNWYYAGNGNLQYVCVNWIDYVLHSTFNCVYLSEFNKTDVTVKFDNSIIFECEETENILESICSTLNIIALRTKYKIYILKIIESDDQLKFEKILDFKSEFPYTSMSFDNHHKNILYVTTLDNKLLIINLDRLKTRTVKVKGNKTGLINNWHTVIGAERDCYMYVTKLSISRYDKRTNNIINVWKGLRNVTDNVDCNDITVAKHLEGTSSLYLGTDHNLLLMDLRSQGSRKFRAVQRWTHGMESVPTFISSCYMEFDKNLICLSSQWCEDMCVVPNYNYHIKEPASGGMTIPYRPPSILNSLKEAHKKMLCFDLYNPLEDRLLTAIVGNLVFEQGDKFDVLMLNSLGDITCHTLFPEHMDTFIEDDTAECLQTWANNYKLDDKEFVVSSIANIGSVLRQLKKLPPDYKVDGWVKTKTNYNEQEVIDAFENEDLEIGLEEAWNSGKDINETNVESESCHLNYSDQDLSND